MKIKLNLIILAAWLISFDQFGNLRNHTKLVAATTLFDYSTANTNKINKITINDSLVFLEDTLFAELQLVFNEISIAEFQSYRNESKLQCGIDSGQFISGSGLFVKRECDNICETFLVERRSNTKMLLPSSYDAGILNISLSPSCNQLIICSSYDGEDYSDYYENRAEFFVLSVQVANGLQGIKPLSKFSTNDWSIDNLTWVNDKTIVLRVYTEGRLGRGTAIHYKYLKTEFH